MTGGAGLRSEKEEEREEDDDEEEACAKIRGGGIPGDAREIGKRLRSPVVAPAPLALTLEQRTRSITSSIARRVSLTPSRKEVLGSHS